ncbi:winged helix-turn-helix transcriptional regulator [Virgibacillus flavescens]|uniref:winged helix-turn-helix transcriptional regulator n=1 Tax=Virgibacillus flavescens TaxID=1611422 RepID=UPI003D346394
MMKHPVRIALDAVCGKWKALILWYLHDETLRFGELRRLLPDVSQKVLTQQLRELEEDGLVERTAHPEVPPRVEYTLSPYGKELEPTLQLLYQWGKDHTGILTKNNAKNNADKDKEPTAN